MSTIGDYIEASRKFRELRDAYEAELAKLSPMKWEMDHAQALAEACVGERSE